MKKYAGFTLIELIITVAIAAIVLAIGIPSFKETILQNRLTTYTNQLIGAINLARSEAIKRGVRVTLCPSNGADCEAIGYEKGWIVFSDLNNNAKLDTANDEIIIRIFEKMPDGMTLTGDDNVKTYISYTGDGVSRLNGGAFQTGTLTLCKDGKARQIILSSPGRLRVETNPTSFSCPS